MSLTIEQNAKINKFINDYLPSIETEILSTALCTSAIELVGGWDRFIKIVKDCEGDARLFNYKKIADKHIAVVGDDSILNFYNDNQASFVKYVDTYADYMHQDSGLHYLNNFAYKFPEFDKPTKKSTKKILKRVFTDNNPTGEDDHTHKLHIARFVTFDYITNFCLAWFEFQKVEEGVEA